MKKMILLFLHCASCCVYADNPIILNDQAKEWEKKCSISDCMIFFGNDNKFIDISTLTPAEAKNYELKGVKAIETLANNGICPKDFPKYSYSLILAGYFEHTKEYKKALYWADKGATSGSCDCMLILERFYFSGNGVVKDIVEGLKWGILAFSIDPKRSKGFKETFKDCEDCKEYIEANKRAINWMHDHKSAFFSPD